MKTGANKAEQIQIVAAFQAGDSVANLAEKFGLSDDYVGKLVRHYAPKEVKPVAAEEEKPKKRKRKLFDSEGE